MKKENSIHSVATDIKECIKIISDRMMQLRPRGEVEYIPFYKNDVFYMEQSKGKMHVDLKKLYPYAKCGEYVYAGTMLRACIEHDILLYIWGDAELYYDNEKIYDRSETADYDEIEGSYVRMHLKQGDNPLMFKVRCTEDDFKFSFMASIPYYKWWAKDYIFNSRAISPIDCFSGEDGIGVSELCRNDEPFNGEYVFPKKAVPSNEIDYFKFYRENSGDIAYALSYALKDGEISLDFRSDTQIIINGKRIPLSHRLKVNKGDEILIKSLRGEKWGFSFEKTDIIGIPFLNSKRDRNDKFLIIGTFGTRDTFDMKYAPEFGVNITHPYIDNEWKQTFWRLNEDNVFLRIYVDTSFFAQWFYALMVGQFGMLDAAQALCDNELKQYFYDSISVLCAYYDYCKYDLELFGTTNFLQNIAAKDFDNIGSMCMNFAELCKINPDSNARYVMEKLYNTAIQNIPKYDDGVFHRPKSELTPDTMWADDTYMITPFLVRMGLLNNEDFYFNEVIRQFKGYHEKLYMEEEGIYSHIYFTEEATANSVPWGRGNGWIFNSLSDVLCHIPDKIEGKNDLLEMFKSFAYALKKYQDSDGLWHQVLNIPESYSETSCTAMFLLGMCRGVNNGWLKREDFEGVIKKAYAGLIKKKIDSKGNIYDVCRGSSCSMEAKYYMQLGTIDNDDHGTGIILSAFSEYLKMLQEI